MTMPIETPVYRSFYTEKRCKSKLFSLTIALFKALQKEGVLEYMQYPEQIAMDIVYFMAERYFFRATIRQVSGARRL